MSTYKYKYFLFQFLCSSVPNHFILKYLIERIFVQFNEKENQNKLEKSVEDHLFMFELEKKKGNIANDVQHDILKKLNIMKTKISDDDNNNNYNSDNSNNNNNNNDNNNDDNNNSSNDNNNDKKTSIMNKKSNIYDLSNLLKSFLSQEENELIENSKNKGM